VLIQFAHQYHKPTIGLYFRQEETADRRWPCR
jgi:hypothetical protein